MGKGGKREEKVCLCEWGCMKTVWQRHFKSLFFHSFNLFKMFFDMLASENDFYTHTHSNITTESQLTHSLTRVCLLSRYFFFVHIFAYIAHEISFSQLHLSSPFSNFDAAEKQEKQWSIKSVESINCFSFVSQLLPFSSVLLLFRECSDMFFFYGPFCSHVSRLPLHHIASNFAAKAIHCNWEVFFLKWNQQQNWQQSK